MSFELQSHRDGLARIGSLETKHGTVETPLLMPVINPKQLEYLSIDEMTNIGMNMLITNSYIIWKTPHLREKAIQHGLHHLLDFKGPIMTDSGAFQLMVYGDVEVDNIEITKFQEKMNSDIGVFLDIPLAKGAWNDFKEALEITLTRADQHISVRSKDTIHWAGPIQGGQYLDLVKESAKKMGVRPFDIHAIGSVVPLMESYQYETVVKMILTAKKYLPPSRPVHLFGAGHPMVFALAVYLGIDLFDSAAYILFAKNDRYLTVNGTHRLEDMLYLPCNCPICSSITAKELKQLSKNQRISFLAKHNLYISFKEIKAIKHAIVEGRLLNHVYSRCVRHPALYNAMSAVLERKNLDFIEHFEPASKKKALFVSHPELASQPLILRYRSRIINRFYQYKNDLYLVDGSTLNWPLPGVKNGQLIVLDDIFGPIPTELQSMYPLMQHLKVKSIETIAKKTIDTFIDTFKETSNLHYQTGLAEKYDALENATEFEVLLKDKIDPVERVKALLEYQFGKGASNDLGDIQVETSKRTGIIRQFYSEADKPLGTLRANDFTIIPQIRLCRILVNNLNPPTNRIIAQDDAVPFIRKKRSLFSKHVVDIDEKARMGDEIFIVDRNNELIGTGQLNLSPKEIKSFKRGIAVDTRRAIE